MSAIHRRFVDRFVGPSVPSRVSRRWVSPHGAPLPSRGSRRARFPAFRGTTRALRLPAPAYPVPYGFGPGPLMLLRPSCSPRRSRGGGDPPSGLGSLVHRAPLSGMPHEDPRGISQVSWPSIPHLCPVPRPRPDRRGLAIADSSVLPPAPTRRRLQRDMMSRLPQGFGVCCLRFTSVVAAARARLASGWRAAPLPGGS
jgi:hypothetical protein